jgi:hypothetical protein
MTYTPREINDIINLKGANGKQINIFDLHFVLYIGNVENRQWNVGQDGRFTMYSEHSIGVDPFRFDLCTNPDEVKTEFSQVIYEAMKEAL